MLFASRVLPILLFPCILIITGCARYTEFRSVSPGKEELVIKKDSAGAASYTFDVFVFVNKSRKVIFQKATDSAIGLVEVHWPTDGKSVGILICDMLSGPIFISYDISESRALEPSYFKAQLTAQLLRKYKNRPISDGDVVPWACSIEGRSAYKARRD